MHRSSALLVALVVVSCVGSVGGADPVDAGQSADAGQTVIDAGELDAGPIITGPTIALVGKDWSPHRDDAGLVLLSDYPQLPANQWVRLTGPNSTVLSVGAMPPYVNGYGSDGFHNIISAWGGASWDSVNDRLNLSGGGHGDSSAAQTEIIAVDGRTMKIEVVVARQPLASALNLNPTTKVLFAGEGYPGGYNLPLATGVPGSMHTYNGLRWLSPEVMAGLNLPAPRLGGLFYPGNARAVVNLDTGVYTPLHWKISALDISYISAVYWKKRIVLPRASFYFGRWDMSLTEMTDWQGAAAGGFNATPSVPAFGKDIAPRTSNTDLVYSNRTFVDLPGRGEFISFSGVHQRVRYGAAEDADAADWTAFQAPVTLVGPGARALNTPSNFIDNGTLLLNNAGAHFLASTGEVFVCPNLQDAKVFRITGLAAGNEGTVTELPGSETLTTSGNGTYGRFVVFERGGTVVALRVPSAEAPIEVMRIAP